MDQVNPSGPLHHGRLRAGEVRRTSDVLTPNGDQNLSETPSRSCRDRIGRQSGAPLQNSNERDDHGGLPFKRSLFFQSRSDRWYYRALGRSSVMERYIAPANVDHYFSLLNGNDPTSRNRRTITKLLIEARTSSVMIWSSSNLPRAEPRMASKG